MAGFSGAKRTRGMWIALGAGIGTAIGVAMGEIAVGVAVGIGAGLILSVVSASGGFGKSP